MEEYKLYLVGHAKIKPGKFAEATKWWSEKGAPDTLSRPWTKSLKCFAGQFGLGGEYDIEIWQELENYAALDQMDKWIIEDPKSIILGYAGSDIVKNGVIDVGADNTGTGVSSVRQLGPITETSPSSGIFEFDLDVLYTDGPSSTICPETTDATGYSSLTNPGTKSSIASRFDAGEPSTGEYCILQGDIITVEYTDPADVSGDTNTVTDSATFDLRNGALQSDKSVYVIGSDMILTLIEPDLDLDNDLAETYDLDLIEWDSDASSRR